eukprot:143003-Pyramimonas_sp.AAC.1
MVGAEAVVKAESESVETLRQSQSQGPAQGPWQETEGSRAEPGALVRRQRARPSRGPLFRGPRGPRAGPRS